DDYLTKPFEDTELLDAIEKRLKRIEQFAGDFIATPKGLNDFFDSLTGADSLDKLTHEKRSKKFNKKVEANVETAFQSGDWGPEKHRASAFHAEAKYNTLNKSNYSIIVEYNEAAGDKNPLDGEHGTFCNLFPANHGKYGYMDYISWQNMKEIALRNELDIRKDLKAKLNYHRFRLQNAKDAWYRSNKSVFDSRRDAAGLSGTDIGSEIDLVLTKKLKANLEIEAGISKFKAGDFVKNTAKAGAETTDPSWGYIQVLKRW
ncbi:MAG TPA: alginate export family protein, partial [Candidatus Wallbacteria bacterium]|nr:alginate export family protein [Candidatus Wallbacteria bacterium]